MKDFTGIDIDVPAVEQKPEVHIIGRSSSSRSVTLYRYTKRVSTADEEYTDNHSWSEVHDIIHFFYGDAPAAQFEAGHKQGGSYCCVGCAAHSAQFADIAYTYRAPKLSIHEDKNLFFRETHGEKEKIYMHIVCKHVCTHT